MLVYNDGSEIRAMTGDYTITAPEGFDNKKAGEYTFTVKYAKDASITAQFKVVVKAASDETTGGEPEAPEGVNPLAWIIPVVAAVVIGGAIAAVIIVKKKRTNNENVRRFAVCRKQKRTTGRASAFGVLRRFFLVLCAARAVIKS